MIDETIEPNTRWSDAREWLGDRWDAVRSSVEELWPIYLLAIFLISCLGWCVRDNHSQAQAIATCSAGNAAECRQAVQAESSYPLQQTFLLDYKLATRHDLK
jgi:hypothetical protein